MAATPWQHDKTTTERGYGWQWQKLREAILKRDMHLCQPCKAAGKYTPADAVDHIVPKAQGGTDDPANLQGICTACHDRKTAEDNGRHVRQTIGADGWPVQ